jgi:hypothetical protein
MLVHRDDFCFRKMKKSILASLFVMVCGSFLSVQAPICFADDESGCLICHKYPGLVTGKDIEIKAFHIDEQAFLNSYHGKLTCKQCHLNISKVPHTGQNTVACITDACHTTAKDRAIIEKFPLRSLHKEEHSFIVTLQDSSSCRACHALYPHSQNHLVRALLNMHTGFMTCEVCHLKNDGLGRIAYDWKQPDHVEFSNRPYGSLYDPDRGLIMTTGGLISRLAVYVWEQGEKTLRMHSQDTDRANRFLLEEKGLNNGEKKSRLKYFHRDISRKEISVACKECHRHQGMLDFDRLGFDEKKSKYLMSLDLAGLVSRYGVFYFPDLFGH